MAECPHSSNHQCCHNHTTTRSPLQANQANMLDLSTKESRKHYEHAMKSLFPDSKKFAVKPEKFQIFINLLFQCLMDLGMFGTRMICMIPPNPANPGVGTPINMVSNYGWVSSEQGSAWVSTFITGNNCNTQTSKMLFDLLTSSLSIEVLQHIQLWQGQYENNGLVSGKCYLEVII